MLDTVIGSGGLSLCFVDHHFYDFCIGLLHANFANMSHAADGSAGILLQNAGIGLVDLAFHS